MSKYTVMKATIVLCIIGLFPMLQTRESFPQSVEDLLVEQELKSPLETKGRVRYAIAPECLKQHATSGVVALLVRNYDEPDLLGTGFYIDRRGHILTAAHLFPKGQPTALLKRANGILSEARVVATEPRFGLTLLRDKKGDGAFLPLGDFSSLQRGATLQTITWPDFGVLEPEPTTVGLFKSSQIRMCCRSAEVLFTSEETQPAKYWDASQEAIRLQFDPRPEWSGGPLLDKHGEVLAVCMGEAIPIETTPQPVQKKFSQSHYSVKVHLFAKRLLPAELRSLTEPPAFSDQFAPDEKRRTMNAWKIWLRDAHLDRVPRIVSDINDIFVLDQLQPVQDYVRDGNRVSSLNVEYAKAYEVRQVELKQKMLDWMFRPDPELPVFVDSEHIRKYSEPDVLLPPSEAGQSYAIPVYLAKIAFRRWLD